MAVGAVAETAVFGKPEYVTEIARQFLRLYVERTEALYARRIYDISIGMHIAIGITVWYYLPVWQTENRRHAAKAASR